MCVDTYVYTHTHTIVQTLPLVFFEFTLCGSSDAVHSQKLDGGLAKAAGIVRCWSSWFINISREHF